MKHSYIPDDGGQNQEFQVHEQRLHYLVGQPFQDKLPTYETAMRSTE